MKLHFTKMHGAGNDFIMIDDRALTTPWEDYLRMSTIAVRRTGIGCEGIILLQPSDRADFYMRFLNPDGSEAEMCGNGARCAAAFARSLGIVGRSMTMDTRAGLVDAEILDDGVKIWMTDPGRRRYNLTVTIDGVEYTGHFIQAGCPHFVVPVPADRLDTFDVVRVGAQIRQHELFAPDGTNVDFVSYIQPNRIRMRTYERGVEAESGACGTGAVASAVVGVECADFTLPVKVTTSAGFELAVDGDWRTKKCTGMTLAGPAQFVYEGTIDLDAIETSQDMTC